MIERRYLQNAAYAKNAAADAERRKLTAVVDLFKKYGAQYKMDYLLMAAQGYQESTLDHSVRSPVGAIGVMQVMPPTGKELNVGDITQIDANIHAGVKYMRFMMDEYFANEPMDDLNKALMAFAAYNAGPGRLRQLRRETEKRGLNPNLWFNNVERVASERIGRETVTYVSNIFKYYLTYRLLCDQQAATRGGEGAGGDGQVARVARHLPPEGGSHSRLKAAFCECGFRLQPEGSGQPRTAHVITACCDPAGTFQGRGSAFIDSFGFPAIAAAVSAG